MPPNTSRSLRSESGWQALTVEISRTELAERVDAQHDQLERCYTPVYGLKIPETETWERHVSF